MDIYLALLLFFFFFFLYWVITELFTFIFRLTGLPVEKARFQVISLLTGTGFTTRESEIILSSRLRRRLARITMLFVYVFNVLIFIFMRVPKIHAWGDNLLRRAADRVFDRRETFNAVMLIDNIRSESIAQVTLRHIPDEFRGRTLAETQLRADTGILVMLVERGRGKAMPAQADTVFEPGDQLTVFGDYRAICKAFHAREHFMDERTGGTPAEEEGTT